MDPFSGKQKERDRKVEAKNLADAKVQQARLLVELKNSFGKSGKMTVGDFAKLWLKSKSVDLQPSTQLNYETALSKLDWLGRRDIAKVVPADILRWKDGLVGQPATKNGYLRVLKNMFADASIQLQLRSDPTQRIKAFKERKKTEVEDSNCLSVDELRQVLAVTEVRYPQWHPLYMTMAYTGARFGAVTALKWKDIDYKNKVITFRRAHWQGKVKETKTGHLRKVPLHDDLATVLKAYRKLQMKEGVQLKLKSELVFPSGNGTFLRNVKGVATTWKKALAEVGITRRVTLGQGLRRTANNLLRQHASGQVVRGDIVKSSGSRDVI